jgi:hypothetical protein
VNTRIFVSYSHRDQEVARQIVLTLKKEGLKPWLDEEEIGPGDSFIEGMNRGLGDASYVLLLLSTASVNSFWVSREWMAELATRATVVVPIVLDDCDVPPLLRDIVHFDLRNDRASGVQKIVDFKMLRQGDALVFKKYSQMKLQMKHEALEKLNRRANEMSAEKAGDRIGTVSVQ